MGSPADPQALRWKIVAVAIKVPRDQRFYAFAWAESALAVFRMMAPCVAVRHRLRLDTHHLSRLSCGRLLRYERVKRLRARHWCNVRTRLDRDKVIGCFTSVVDRIAQREAPRYHP
jgi:hypothetical protein